MGAGPGDPGLLTLKGKAAVERADSVIYDFLANEALLRFAPPHAELISVGKRARHATLPQQAINRMLIRKAREGRTVVRLKGGDPFIFGRGGEEALALATAGIPFEVVPGVSSGYAAPAYAGIPVTHRHLASSVTFITGHEDPAKADSPLDWPKFAASGGTLVLFMGMKNLPQITRALMQHGRNPGTPAAVIHRGTRADQQVIEGPLAEIARLAKSVEPPVVTIIGDVVRLGRRLRWRGQMPLAGRRIVITRARDQAAELYEPLEELGAEVIEIHSIQIRPPRSWKRFDRAIRRIEDFDYLLVTSSNGARSLLARLAACGRDVRDLKGLKIGAIGPGTAAEFAKAGIKVDFVPNEYRAEGLLDALAGRDLRGKRFLIPRAKVARDLLPKALREGGARVEVVEAYETVAPRLSAKSLRSWLNPPPDAITFTSSSTAVNFFKLLRGRDRRALPRRTALASIGPITSDTLRSLGCKVAVEAKESTIAGLVRALCHYFSKHH